MKERNNHSYHFTESSPEDRAFYAEEAARMTRADRVRGRTLPLVGFLTSLLILLMIPVWYGILYGNVTPMACLCFGVLLALPAIPCHLLGGNREVIPIEWVRSLLYGAGILFNGMATALCVAAYYLHLGSLPSAAESRMVTVAVILLLGLTALLLQLFPDRYGVVTVAVSLLTVALGTASVVFWIRNDEKTLWSLGFFLLLWVLISVIALHVACSDEESPWLRFASFAAFGLLLLVAAVVLLILLCVAGDGCDCDCDGGCCDCDGGCCDCGGGSDKPRARRKTRRHLGM